MLAATFTLFGVNSIFIHLLYGILRMSPLEIIVSLGMVGLFLIIEKVKEERKKNKRWFVA